MHFLIDDPEEDGGSPPVATVLLAHGAGAAMDSPGMLAIAKALMEQGLRVVRFEFGYMAARREGVRKPPPRANLLNPEYLEAVEQIRSDFDGPLIIGGKSMGGRVASMVADELHRQGKINALVCFGYPFHPPEKPGQLRTDHLADLKTPTLICQGTRDPFGTRDEVHGYTLSDAIEILWLEDGDHDLKPRKTISGFSAADHLRTMAEAVASFAKRVA
jgi:predicted alpha/beta-hydrolase family hydrolase